MNKEQQFNHFASVIEEQMQLRIEQDAEKIEALKNQIAELEAQLGISSQVDRNYQQPLPPQEREQEFQFLYWNEDSEADEPEELIVKATSIDQACEQFLSLKKNDIIRVDYEVRLGREYIDITNHKGFENLI